MFNVTVLCVVVMMALTMLFFVNNNVNLKVELAELKIRNRYRYNNLLREAYHNFIAKMDDGKSAKAEASWRFREALACGCTREEAEKAKANPNWEVTSR